MAITMSMVKVSARPIPEGEEEAEEEAKTTAAPASSS